MEKVLSGELNKTSVGCNYLCRCWSCSNPVEGVITCNPKRAAMISFIGGVLIFLLYYFTANENLFFVGLAYVVVTGLLNLVLLTFILVRASKTVKKNGNCFKQQVLCS
jgi:hypothetical protein